MEYLISFLEGIITFVSPCMLPLLPLYAAYFGGGASSGKALLHAVGFVLGFTLVFVTMGAFAATAGSFLREYQGQVDLAAGAIIVLFGLNYTGLFSIGFLNRTYALDMQVRPLGIGSAILFGMVFALGWTPGVGAFLGSALLLASQQDSAVRGVGMLLCYSLGLGIPFVVATMLLDHLKGALAAVKENYQLINRICGILLIVLGLLMMSGWLGVFLGMLSF